MSASRICRRRRLTLNPNRLDLTHLKVYTIDDESTREIDDGLSVESVSQMDDSGSGFTSPILAAG